MWWRSTRRAGPMGCTATPGALLVLLSCLSGPGSRAHAQVNTETLRLGKPEEGWHGNLTGNMALKRGNVELLELGADGKTFYRTGVHTPMLVARAEFGQQGGERFTENTFAHARWTAMWLERVGSEVFGQLQYDSFVRLKFRALGGAGARFALVLTEWFEWYAGTGYMLEHEVLDIPATDSHPQTTLNHRSTSYLSVKLQLAPVLALQNVVYLQPRFDKPDDVRVLDELTVEARVNDTFSLLNSLSLRYDSIPPDAVRKLDLGLTVGIRASF